KAAGAGSAKRCGTHSQGARALDRGGGVLPRRAARLRARRRNRGLARRGSGDQGARRVLMLLTSAAIRPRAYVLSFYHVVRAVLDWQWQRILRARDVSGRLRNDVY